MAVEKKQRNKKYNKECCFRKSVNSDMVEPVTQKFLLFTPFPAVVLCHPWSLWSLQFLGSVSAACCSDSPESCPEGM